MNIIKPELKGCVDSPNLVVVLGMSGCRHGDCYDAGEMNGKSEMIHMIQDNVDIGDNSYEGNHKCRSECKVRKENDRR